MQNVLARTFILAAASTSMAHAANNNESTRLEETVVTATRSETPSNELATATTVFTREDIQQLQVRTLPDLLKNSAGLDVTQQGGYGQQSSVFMRGTNSSHVLVLIDGIKVGSVTLGLTPFELIPIEQIERVEISRGPNSSLYGSEAIGGVIQIFTRKGQHSEKPKVSVDAGAGSWDTHREAGNVSGRWQDTWYNLGVSNIESRGFAPQVVAPQGVENRGDYDNTAMNASVGHRFQNNAELEAFFIHSFGNSRFQGFSAAWPNNRQFMNQVVGVSGAIDVLSNWRSSLRFGQSRSDEFSFGGTNIGNDTVFNTTRWNATWLNEVTLSNNHKMTLGTDYRVDEVDGNQVFTKNSRYDIGIFGEMHSRIFDNHFINASIRWDENQAFGDYVTGNIGWRFNWQYGLSAFASFGNAFKAPTFNDLYYPLDNFGYKGNPNLKPEVSETTEVGIAGLHNLLQWQLRAYHTDITDLISWDNWVTQTPENVDKAQIDGLEIELATQTWGWNHKLTGNLLSPRNRITNTRLLNRADKTLSYDLSRNFGPVDVGATVLAQSDRPAFGDRSVDGFVTLDLRTAYHFDKNWMVSGKLNNLLDKHYQTVSNYNMADRNFFISIHYNN